MADLGNNNRQAHLTWSKEGLPISTQFEDFYFSIKDGLTESRYVYIEGNDLPHRWMNLSSNQTGEDSAIEGSVIEDFVIAETGFGTGLNFLATWQQWQKSAPASTKLHYISIEKHPLSIADLKKSLVLWPELNDLSQQLIEQYPLHLNRGFHRLNFHSSSNNNNNTSHTNTTHTSNIELTLIIDDALTGLEQLLQSDHPAHQRPQRAIDAWYLDGFSPNKNPDMWQPELFHLVQKLSHQNTTAATFSAARIVQNGFTEHGFKIEKTPGFGKKREMIKAYLKQQYALPTIDKFPESKVNTKHSLAWNISGATTAKTSFKNNLSVTVIGGGLAGCHIANALAQRHYKVTLIERHNALAQEGSGNPQGVLYAKLSHKAETLSDFNLMALQFAQRHYQSYWESSAQEFGQQCGVLHLAQSDQDKQQHSKIIEAFGTNKLLEPLSPEQASAQAGLRTNNGGLFFSQSGWLNPKAICEALTKHSNISIVYNQQPLQLNQPTDDPHWHLLNNKGDTIATSDIVIIANANDAKKFSQCSQLPFKPVRGQISQITIDDKHTDAQQISPNTVLCSEGYISPSHDGKLCFGASFDTRNQNLDIRNEEHQQNIDRIRSQFPGLIADSITPFDCTGRAALRCTTPDYLPLVGPVPIHDDFIEDFQLLRKNAKSSIATTGSYHPNLYVNSGYGSRGLTYAPLCAEMLAAHINQEPAPVSRSLQTALNPARFIIRNLSRNKI
jgi:tRNA 5-methylaminomethyl-2-thiouridine biosynthesis bifunctional protein